MTKKKSIEEQIKENNKNIDEFVKQLKLAGVKDKTIKMLMKDIQEYQEKLWQQRTKEMLENMRKRVLGDEYYNENI